MAASLGALQALEGLPSTDGDRVLFWLSLGLLATAVLAATVTVGTPGRPRAALWRWLRRYLPAALLGVALAVSAVRWAEADTGAETASAASREVATASSASDSGGSADGQGAAASPAASRPNDAAAAPEDPRRPCGKERWPVKTLSDPAADEVRSQAERSSVNQLTEFEPPPRVGGELPRTGSVERTRFTIEADLREARYVGGNGEDRDIHLVVADPRSGRTMIVEFPDVTCPGAAESAFRDRMLKARVDFERLCGGRPPQSFAAYGGTAEIEGVGFFDKRHGQRGLARNGIELHPVLEFRSANCARAP